MSTIEVGIAMLVLSAATQVIDGIQQGMAERGYPDIRPAHGFAFARVAAGDAAVLDIAAHLGVSKQAASQLVDQLVQGGYLRRRPDPADARRRILTLTAAGRRCTQAAEEAAHDAVAAWRPRLGTSGLRELRALLAHLGLEGPVRPAW